MAARRRGIEAKHPLQQIRLSLNLTQAAFAKSLGISLRALESIEGCRRREARGIDGKLAAIIVEIYGARRGSFERPGLTPKTWQGKPYPADASSFLKDFRERKERSTDRALRQAKIILRVIDLLVQAALEKKCLPLVRLSLADWVRDTLKRCELSDAFTRAHSQNISFDQILQNRMLEFTAKERRWLKSMTGYPLRGPKQVQLDLEDRARWLTLSEISAYSAKRLLYEALRDLDPGADWENIFKLGAGPKWGTRIADD